LWLSAGKGSKGTHPREGGGLPCHQKKARSELDAVQGLAGGLQHLTAVPRPKVLVPHKIENLELNISFLFLESVKVKAIAFTLALSKKKNMKYLILIV